MGSTRKDDLRLDVQQQRNDKALLITAADAELAQYLGLGADEMVGNDLRTLLPRNIQELIEQYLEFDSDIQDLSAVLGKIRQFGLLHKKGREIRFSLKILRDISTNEHPCFQLHLSRLKVMESLRQQLNLPDPDEEDALDATAGMPGRASFLRHVKVVNEAVAQGKVNACVALLRIDQYNDLTHKNGTEAPKILLKAIGQVIRTNLREDDVMGYVEPNRVAALLLETKKENAKIPLNRIRWMFAAHPVDMPKEKGITVTLTATYFELDGSGTPAAQIEQCQRMLREAGFNAGNTIIEPVAD